LEGSHVFGRFEVSGLEIVEVGVAELGGFQGSAHFEVYCNVVGLFEAFFDERKKFLVIEPRHVHFW
jgi:hypothetical protein